MVESQSQRQEPQAGMLCCGNLALLWQHCRLGGRGNEPACSTAPAECLDVALSARAGQGVAAPGRDS